MAKGKLFLIHWKDSEIDGLAAPLRAQGWLVDTEAQDGVRAAGIVKADPPDAVVIYLRRLPSHGRETADALASMKATRHVPMIFVDGQGEALEKTKARVPAATYVTADQLGTALDRLVPQRTRQRQT